MEINNNDVLRRIRYTFDLDDAEMIRVFGLAGQDVSRAQVSDWLKRDEDEAFATLDDLGLATFLNGFIIRQRGRREGPQPKPESELNNNLILLKLRIALNLQADDVLELIRSDELEFSRHALEVPQMTAVGSQVVVWRRGHYEVNAACRKRPHRLYVVTANDLVDW